MRYKTLLTMIFITIMLLMNVTSTISSSNAPLGEETEYRGESSYNQTPSQSAGEGYASSPTGLRGDPKSINSATKSSGTEKANPNMFNFDSFAKDLSSHKTEEWRNFAYINDDSTELVIGLNDAQSDYIKVSDLIFESRGKLVNTVSMRGEVVAVVADVPLDVVSFFVAQLQASNLVRYVEPNMKFEAQFVPNDPDWNLQWGPQKIEADWAWNTTMGDPSVLVGIIDTGIDYTHPDLNASYVPLGKDEVNNDSDPKDDNGHGTHVAGTIAAVLNNGVGVAGLAKVKFFSEKAFDQYGSGWEDDITEAIYHAVDSGANILSNSWGGPDSQLIHDAMKYAYDKGVLITAAAGNSASSQKLYPAAYDEVVAVTATDSYDSPAVFTNFGDWVEVAAPGVDIYSTMPTYHVYLNDLGYPMNYSNLSGTSMATPHVSGTAALIWSQFPNMTRDWVRAQLRFTADDLGDQGFDKYYGYGRINARKAVEQAPANHDLLIYNWQRPKFVQPGDLVNFNVTVLNFGKNNESNLTIDLIVDGNVMDSAPLGSLASGYSDTVNVMWNASVEGKYNVTVWVEPVPGEDRTENNVLSLNINVQSIQVVLFKNVDPWGSTANEEVLSQYGIPHAVFNSNDFGQINITSFSKVIIASDQDQTFYNGMDRYRSWFENYVSNGGVLEIHAADWGWNGGGWVGTLPGGLQWSHFSSDSVTIVDPTHPVVTVPNPITNPELDNWHSSVHGYFSGYPLSSHIVIKEDLTNQPAYLEFNYGAGIVLASSQPLEFAYMRRLSLILENSLLYTAVKYPHELAVFLEAPAYHEPGYSVTLNATVLNVGLNTENNVTLQILVDGSIVSSVKIQEFKNGSSYTLSYFWSLPAKGSYNVTAYAPPVPEEQFAFNNKMTQLVEVRYPLIRPVVGQWANYQIDYYDNAGRIIGTGFWNLTYDHYVEPYVVYITMWFKDPSGYNATAWMTVNIMNRWVESGIWAGMWYPGWIETDIGIGSIINLLYGAATVNGSRIIPVGIYPIDCWEIPLAEFGYQYTFWHDKVSGLWIGMDYTGYPQSAKLRLVDTNIPIGSLYEHELAAVVEAPDLLEPDHSSLLNATAYNVGLNKESNVKLSLMIDGTEVKSAIIPTLLNGSSYTISYQWAPTLEATYYVTAYVQPVPGEAFNENNAATKMVVVRTVKGYVLFDQTHWTDSIFSYSLWISNLTDRGYVVDTLYTSPITPSALAGYDVFIIPQAHNYYDSSELSAIQDFVQKGGGLLVIGDDSPYIYTDLTKFAGITWEWGGYSGDTRDITPHLVTEGVNTAYFGSPSSRLFVSLPAQDLIRDTFKNVLLAVSEAKTGAVIGIADEDSVNDWSIKNADNLRLANNMIDWLKGRRPIASFTYLPLDPYVGETVTFDGSASYDPDGTIVSYLWDFGDIGNGNGVTATHVYSAGGMYKVALTAIDNEGVNSTATVNITITRTTIEVSVEVGSIYFRGELAEFYILVSSLGKPIDADLTATLYYGGTIYADLSPKVTQIGTGLYRIPYTVPMVASSGIYALSVEASYLTLKGVALKSFLLSSTLTGWNALLVNINGTVGTLNTNTGLIKVQLDVINAKLVSIDGNVATINSTIGLIQTDIGTINAKIIGLEDTVATIQTDVGNITTDIASIQLRITSINGTIATIQTTLGTIKGTITSIQGDVATIKTDVGTVKASLPPGWIEAQQQTTTPLYILTILVLIISIGTVITMFLRRKKS